MLKSSSVSSHSCGFFTVLSLFPFCYSFHMQPVAERQGNEAWANSASTVNSEPV
jgi:hypothetical protein